MNTTPTDAVILKTDALGQVRTPAARRERLLDESERSDMSGLAFAEFVGIKCQTFATWVQLGLTRFDGHLGGGRRMGVLVQLGFKSTGD